MPGRILTKRKASGLEPRTPNIKSSSPFRATVLTTDYLPDEADEEDELEASWKPRLRRE
jgi:hypothetical protein